MPPTDEGRHPGGRWSHSRGAGTGGHHGDLVELIRTPWLSDVVAVAAALRTDPRNGLSSEEAAARLERIGPNRLAQAARVPTWRKVLGQFRDPLVYLLLGAVVVSLAAWVIEGATGVPYEALVIAVILVANAVLGYVQEARAEAAVEALQAMSAATATVVRDGVERAVPTEDLVPGDVVLLAEGDAVSADARLVEAASLRVAEAALTGESEAILKDARPLAGEVPLAERRNMVFSGTAVAAGRGRCIVTATATATEVGRIADLLEATEEEPSPLQVEIRRVSGLLGRAVLAIAAVVVAAIFATSEIDEAGDVVEVLVVGVSLAVAAVPEGLPAVLSVVLALGVQRMARRNAIVKRLASVETLGSASVICTDKTGTLTRNEMTIQRIVTRSGTVEVTGSGYRPDGSLLTGGRPLDDGPLRQEVEAVLTGGSLANDAALRGDGGTWTVLGDPTEAAFLVAACKAGLGDRLRRFERTAEVPFTSERKLMSTVHVDDEHGTASVFAKGAPDVLLAHCVAALEGTEAVPLTDERRAEIARAVEALADDALRTLGVAVRALPGAAPRQPAEQLEQDLVFAGVVGIIDPPRDEARAAIVDAQQAGIRVVMITGDHPRTAARIAADLGILGEGGRVLTGPELDRLDAGALQHQARHTAVFARVVPEHKLRIVDALQADGHVVAMTGDGVNDAPALKAADIGVAMGITGTDVTKEAGAMILADDDFATIVAAVREGRGIFSNIRKFLRYLLSSNAGEVLTMLLGAVGAGLLGLTDAGGTVAVPLLATQILWINLLTDTAPALAMGVDPPPDDVMARPPRALGDRVIDARMQAGVLFVGLVMAVSTLLALDVGLPGGLVDGDGSLTEARTMAFTTLVLAQLFNCLNARSDRRSAFHRIFTNPWLWAAMAMSALLQVAVVYVPVLNEAFDTAPIAAADWLVCGLLASAVLWADEARKLLSGRRGAR